MSQTKELAQNLRQRGVHVVAVNLNKADSHSPPTSSDLRTKTLPFVSWGSDNYLPHDLANRFRKSSKNRAIINTLIDFVLGNGIESEANASIIESVNADGQHLDAVARKIIRDYKIFGNAFLEIVRINGATFLNHIDATLMRVMKPDMDDQFIHSHLFRERDQTLTAKEIKLGIQQRSRTISNFKLYKGYPDFGEVEGLKGERSILQIKDDEPEHRFYGMPDYLGAYLDGSLDIDYLISKYNLTRFNNQFTPSAIVEINGRLDEDEAKKLQQELEDKFTGENNNSRIFLIVKEGTGKESGSNVTLMNDTSEGTFLNLQKIITDKISSAHRFPPRLAGIKTPGSLGDSKELFIEFEIMVNTVVANYRNIIFSHLKKVFTNEYGISEFDFMFTDKIPFSFLANVDVNQLMNTDEDIRLKIKERLENLL